MREEVRTIFLLRFVACRWYGVWRCDRESVLWGERGCSYRIRLVVSGFVEGWSRLGKVLCTSRLLLFLLVFYMECSTGIVRVCVGVNDGVAIE